MSKVEEIREKYAKGAVVPIHADDDYTRGVLRSIRKDIQTLLTELDQERENVIELKQAMVVLDQARVFAVGKKKEAEEKVRALQKYLPTASELTGSSPDFTGDITTDEYIEKIRRG